GTIDLPGDSLDDVDCSCAASVVHERAGGQPAALRICVRFSTIRGCGKPHLGAAECPLDSRPLRAYDRDMNTTRLYRVLLVVGALATLAQLPLALLLGAYGIHTGPNLDVFMAIIFYVAGAFAAYKRPTHRAARRLLPAGVVYTTDLALARILTVVAAAYGVVPWFWVGNALVLALDNVVFCTILALLAVFPDGAYQRSYERWIVRASWVFVPVVPLLLLLAHPVLYYNIYEIAPGPNAASA